MLYGFMQDEKWYEDVAHILIGLVPFWGWWREHRQWPPGELIRSVWPRREEGQEELLSFTIARLLPEDRVADSYRDFLGYAIGDFIRTGALVYCLMKLSF